MRAEPPSPEPQHPFGYILIGEPSRPRLAAHGVEVPLQQRALILVHVMECRRKQRSTERACTMLVVDSSGFRSRERLRSREKPLKIGPAHHAAPTGSYRL